MADNNPVIVPIQLEVTDLDMDNVNISDLQKSMTQKMSGLTKSINDALSKLGSGKTNKAIENSMGGVERGFSKVVKALTNFNKAVDASGKSSEVYKEHLQALVDEQGKLAGLKEYKAQFEDAEGNYAGAPKGRFGTQWEDYQKACAEYEAQLQKVAELEAQVNNVADYANIGSPENVDKMTQAFMELLQAVGNNEMQINSFNETLAKNQYTDEYVAKLKELEAAQKKVDTLTEKSQKMSEKGASPGAWKGLQVDASMLEQKILDIQADLEELIETGKAFRFGNGDAEAELDAVDGKVNEMLGTLGDMDTKGNSSTVKLVKGFKAVDNILKKVGKSIKSVISKMFKLGKTGKSTTGSLQKTLKKLSKDFLTFFLGFRSAYFLVKKLRSVFMEQFKYLAQSFPEANATMSAFMTSLNQLKGSIITAFEPLANIVLPVLTQFIGKLSQAMSVLGRFFATLTGQNYIYEFTSDNIDAAESMDGTAKAAKNAQKALMGFDEINRLDDNSDSGTETGAQGTWNKVDIEGATSSLAEMIKKCWEQEDFTELGVYLGERLKAGLDMATSVIEGKILETGTKIANAIATTINGFVSVDGLGNSLGTTVGAAINTAMSILDTFLVTTNWIDIGKFIADTINGFITKTDFSLIGKTVGDLVLAGINLFWSTITNIDFTNIGNKIAEGINNIFNTLGETDITGLSGWQKLGQGLSNAVTGLLGLLITALQEIDWQQVGVAIGEFLGSIDWGQIVWDLGALVSSFVSGLCQAFASWAETDPLSASIAALLGTAILGVKVIPNAVKLAEKFKEWKIPEKLGPHLDDLGTKMSGLWESAKGVVKTLGGKLAEGGAGVFAEIKNFFASPAGTKFGGWALVISGIATAFGNFFSMLKDGFSWVKEILMIIGIALAAVGAVILGAPAAVAAAIAAVVAVVLTAIVLIKEHWNEIVQFFKDLWEKVKTVVSEAWTKIKEAIATAWENIKTGVANAIETVKTTIVNVVTAIFNFWKNYWLTIFTVVTTIFETIINAVKTAIEFVKETIINVVTAIKEWWTETWENIKAKAAEIWENLKTFISETITNIKETIINIVTAIKEWWTTTWDTIKTKVTEIWNGIKETISNVITGIKDTISNVIDKIKTFWTEAWDKIKSTVTNIWTTIKTTVSNAVTGVKDTISNVINTLKNTWNTVWDSLKTKVTNIWDGIKSAIKSSINGIIGFINGMIKAVIGGINSAIGALNKLKVKIPDFVPGIGGESFGFNISTLTAPQIPYLAQGAVIPPNKEFVAMLGDQKHGTNIEAPLSTIQEAVATVMDDQLDAMMAGFEAVVAAINNKDLTVAIGDKEIGMASNRYNRRQTLVRGGV